MKLIRLKLNEFKWWHKVRDLHQFSLMTEQGHFVGSEHSPSISDCEALAHSCRS